MRLIPRDGKYTKQTNKVEGEYLDRTGLVIKWEVPDIYITSGHEDSTRLPVHLAIVWQKYSNLFEVWRQLVRSEE